MSNLNFFDETSAFNNFSNKLQKRVSNQPSFLDATESDIDVKGQGEEFDLDEIENMFGYDLSQLEKKLSDKGVEVGQINSIIQGTIFEALAAGSDKNGWVGRDHAPSGFDLESQVAESMRHYNDVLRDDLINHNRQDDEGNESGSDKDHVSLGEYTISDAELKQMNECQEGNNFHFAMENGQVMTPLDRGDRRTSQHASGLKSPTKAHAFKLGDNNGSPLRMKLQALHSNNYRLELCEVPT